MALGCFIGYLLVVELGARIVFSAVNVAFPERFTLLPYVVGWMSKRYVLYDYDVCRFSFDVCEPTRYVITWSSAAAVIGLLAAVEWYLAQDEAEQIRRYEAAVDHIVRWGAGRGDVTVDRVPYGEAGQPTPRAHVRLTTASPAERDAFLAALRATPPRLDLLTDEGADQAAEDAGFYVAPETLQPGEEALIVERLETELARFRDGAFLVAAGERSWT